MLKKMLFPGSVFYYTALVFLIMAVFFGTDAAIDINVGDTYYVITHTHLYLFSTLFYAALGVLYFLLHYFKLQIPKWSIYIHYVSTLSLFLNLISIEIYNLPNRYYTNTNSPNSYMAATLLFFAFGQVLFIFTTIFAAFRRKRT